MLARRRSAQASTPLTPSAEQLLGRDLLHRLDRLDVLSRKLLAGKLPGERRSKRRGRSVEFDDHRPYVAGDDLRHIDWHILGRLDRLVLKLFREDEDLSVHIILDNSPSMDAGEPAKRDAALKLAAALAYIALAKNNRVSVAVVATPGKPAIQRSAARRGRSSIRPTLAFLADALEPGPDTAGRPMTSPQSLPDAVRRIASSARTPGLRILISDLLVPSSLDPMLSALVTSTTGLGADGVVLQVLAPGELDPSLESTRGLAGDVRLTDIETGRAVELTLSPEALRTYQQRLNRHQQHVRAACRARSITHRVVRSDADVGDLLAKELRREGVLG